MVAILFNSAEPFNKMTIPLRKKTRVKSGENWPEKKTFKDYTIL